MADLPTPTIAVSGENRVDDPPLTPPSPKVTLITVIGGGFPPGAAVSLQLESPHIQHGTTAATDGTVFWDPTIERQLDEGATLSVVATYSTDPTNPTAPTLSVQGQGTVDVIVFEHGRGT